MKLHIEDIPEGGRRITAAAADPWARQAAEEASDGAVSDLDLDLLVERIGSGAPSLRVRGTARVGVRRTCDRCQTELLVELGGPVDLFFVPEGHGVGGSQLHSDDLDIGWYDGKELVMADVLSEQLAIWMPDRVRCVDPGVAPQVPDPESHVCAIPDQPEGPDLKKNPFAGLRLPK